MGIRLHQMEREGCCWPILLLVRRIERVMPAVRNSDLYISTHAEYRSAVEERFSKTLATSDKA